MKNIKNNTVNLRKGKNLATVKTKLCLFFFHWKCCDKIVESYVNKTAPKEYKYEKRT